MPLTFERYKNTDKEILVMLAITAKKWNLPCELKNKKYNTRV